MGSFVGPDDEQQQDNQEQAPPEADQSKPSIRDDVEALLNQPQAGSETESSPTDDTPAPSAEEVIEAYKLGDYEIPADQVDDVVNLIQWASNLTEEQAAAALAATSGQSQPQIDFNIEDDTEYEEYEPEQQALPDSIIQMQQTDPATARAMEDMWNAQQRERQLLEEELYEQQRRFQMLEESTGADMATRQQAQYMQAEEAAAGRFSEQYGEINQQTYMALVQKAGELNIVPGLVQQYGEEEGFYRSLEAAMYATPEFRDKTMQQQVQSQVTQAQTSTRKEAAAQLNAPQAGTNIPAQTPDNLPVSERRSAMKRDIEAMLGQ